jgi:brefeldin A-resistance guanine nucleotide exchange factor 1
VHLVDALLGEIADEGHTSVMAVRTRHTEVDPVIPDAPIGSRGPGYDPSFVYILEFCTVIACRDAATAEATAKPVINTLMQVLRAPARFHYLTVARSSFYILSLLHASYVSILFFLSFFCISCQYPSGHPA